MRTRLTAIAAACCGALALAACGTSGGSKASSSTLSPLGPTNYVTVPVTSTTLTGQTVDPNQPGTLPPATGPLGGGSTYAVQSGDILVRIAKKFGCPSAQAIVDANGWTDGFKHVIYPGLKITIPPTCTGSASAGSGGGTATGTTTGGPTTTVDPNAPQTYTVKSGDTLVGIAKKFGTTAAAIVAANGWTDGTKHVIYPGLKIKLPAKKTG